MSETPPMHNIPTINPVCAFHHHYETNTIGRDFIVGDIQGCYDELMGALAGVKFDKTKDRLFCVGDLIDRGPKSFECANLIYEPWCHSTLGNHELMMVRSRLKNDANMHGIWIEHGGLWYVSEEKYVIQDLAKSFSDLPLIISIGNGEKRVNIVHAELKRMISISHTFSPVTNDDIDNWTFNELDVHDMLWGRTLVDIRTPKRSWIMQDIDAKKPFHSDKLSPTYVGHSIVPFRPVQVEQQIYLDTGMVNYFNPKYNKQNCVLTLACPQEEKFYIYTLPWKTTTEYPYTSMRKYT